MKRGREDNYSDRRQAGKTAWASIQDWFAKALRGCCCATQNKTKQNKTLEVDARGSFRRRTSLTTKPNAAAKNAADIPYHGKNPSILHKCTNVPKYNRPPRLCGLKKFKSSAENETKKKREREHGHQEPGSVSLHSSCCRVCLKQAGMKKSFRTKMYSYYRGT